MNQKEGVFSAVCAVLESDEFGAAVELTSEQRATVIEIVTAGLLDGEISMTTDARAKHDDEAKMKGYTNGLVSNWLRKDKRLNGNTIYEIKNPGSRTGAGDTVIRELRKLLKTVTGDHKDAVQREIDKQLAKIQAEKAKTVTINIDQIPKELRHLVNQD